MIVVFTRRLLHCRTDDAQCAEFLCRMHSRRSRCRREEEHLPLTGQEVQDGTHLRTVLLVEEAVELIEHTEAHLLQFQFAEAVQLHDARRRADDERRLFLQRVDLPLYIRPADEGLHADREPCRLNKIPRGARDLHRELMRRCENEYLCRAHGGVNAHECGQEVGERLARPRRSLADQVLACARGRNHLPLDLRRLRDAARSQCRRERLGHAK